MADKVTQSLLSDQERAELHEWLIRCDEAYKLRTALRFYGNGTTPENQHMTAILHKRLKEIGFDE